LSGPQRASLLLLLFLLTCPHQHCTDPLFSFRSQTSVVKLDPLTLQPGSAMAKPPFSLVYT
jgi:hypothetical protein